MGESNGLLKRRLGLPRGVALATAAAYTSLFGEEDGSIPGEEGLQQLGVFEPGQGAMNRLSWGCGCRRRPASVCLSTDCLLRPEAQTCALCARRHPAPPCSHV